MQEKPRQLLKAGTGRRWAGLALGLALLGLTGCYPPSALEQDYGNAMRHNIAQQVVNPRAGFSPQPTVGLPPQAAAYEMEKYDKSFKPTEKKALEMKLLGQ